MTSSPLGDGPSHPHLRLEKMADSDKICGVVNHHRGYGSIRHVDYFYCRLITSWKA